MDKVTTDIPDTIRSIVEQRFGEPRRLHRFETWGPTVVVGATLADDRKIVLKASAAQDVRIEAHTATMAANAGFPTPVILGQGDDPCLPGGHWFAMEHLPGIWWHDADWNRHQHLTMLSKLARHLATLHTVRIDGYGPLTIDGDGTFPTWSSWLRSGFERAACTLNAAGAVPGAFVEALHKAVTELSPELDRRPSVLLHADLGDMEIYVDPVAVSITGIVDWGSSIGGDPLYEFARFVAGGPADDPRPGLYRHPLREQYDRISPPSGHAPAIEMLYDLHNTLLNAEWAMREAPDWIGPLVITAQRHLDELG